MGKDLQRILNAKVPYCHICGCDMPVMALSVEPRYWYCTKHPAYSDEWMRTYERWYKDTGGSPDKTEKDMYAYALRRRIISTITSIARAALKRKERLRGLTSTTVTPFEEQAIKQGDMSILTTGVDGEWIQPSERRHALDTETGLVDVEVELDDTEDHGD